MSVKIHQIQFKDSDNKEFFEFTVKFSVASEDEFYFQQLMDWVPVSYVNNPQLHDEEVGKLTMKFIDIPGSSCSQLEFEGPPVTDDWKHGYMRGYDVLNKEDNVFVFHEFFTKTPVSLALAAEITKFQENPDHTASSEFATISVAYFAMLLQCLFLHWD
jgi:hypothetical protein